jgi:hypothetical protein
MVFVQVRSCHGFLQGERFPYSTFLAIFFRKGASLWANLRSSIFGSAYFLWFFMILKVLSSYEYHASAAMLYARDKVPPAEITLRRVASPEL